ncbi:four helix bundle suffix domain-containing protein [Patescibacteria group bacterium]|nr:four helix bundle suffix domain-containing protein [Patescibacteria group bacterium]MBU1473157.1 four helix bundle suffix domain-containing protein [Patescibacteria group bacterium]MBU2544626.1 four helix bundle suffix domain-containing protein [Patescibacteria group bacterium]
MTNTQKKQGGYENLLVYQLAVIIYDLTAVFCSKYLADLCFRRTVEQMTQAARSGKQNIVEGSLEKSMEGNIKLTGVARASFGELLEDYRDFLRVRHFAVWDKDDERVITIRRMRENTNKTNRSYESYETYMSEPERFANLMVTLCFKEGYLLDQLLRVQEAKFVKEGGFRENLFRKRREYKDKLDKYVQ